MYLRTFWSLLITRQRYNHHHLVLTTLIFFSIRREKICSWWMDKMDECPHVNMFNSQVCTIIRAMFIRDFIVELWSKANKHWTQEQPELTITFFPSQKTTQKNCFTIILSFYYILRTYYVHALSEKFDFQASMNSHHHWQTTAIPPSHPHRQITTKTTKSLMIMLRACQAFLLQHPSSHSKNIKKLFSLSIQLHGLSHSVSVASGECTAIFFSLIFFYFYMKKLPLYVFCVRKHYYDTTYHASFNFYALFRKERNHAYFCAAHSAH